MHRLLVCCLAFALATTSLALASVPTLLNYQGLLRDNAGDPVANGTYSLTFGMYDAPAGGTLLWFESQSVTTSGGLFNVLLGSSTPLPDSAFDGSDRYLGMAVSPDPEMVPRQRLVSVAYSYRVNSVDSAAGGTITSNVSIGPGHINTGANAFVAGDSSSVSGNQSTVSGGHRNAALADGATVSGGMFDTVGGVYGTIGGGRLNKVWGQLNTVGGGLENTATNYAATVGGGQYNYAFGIASTVAGGSNDSASGNSATIGGGYLNKASGTTSTVGGGQENNATGLGSTIAGGFRNSAEGDRSTVAGGGYNRSSGVESTVGGGSYDTAAADWATVAGGRLNKNIGIAATIGGGDRNFASGLLSTIAGGDRNVASAVDATVGGGAFDTASGDVSTVPGGAENVAGGAGSFAAGRKAKARHDGTFVWSEGTTVTSTAPNQFLISAPGGVGIGTTTPNASLAVAGTMSVGGGTPVARVLSAAASLDFPNTASLTFNDLTITVTGAAAGDMVALGTPAGTMTSGAIYTSWVSAANTVTVRFNNLSAGSVNPGAGTFRAAIMQF